MKSMVVFFETRCILQQDYFVDVYVLYIRLFHHERSTKSITVKKYKSDANDAIQSANSRPIKLLY